ncbi:MAG: Eco57I restriction-modification methylase domain-containing protein [Bacteroidetes bacterium]|nr:Eco57I restriction-modification methylase domain-containing protein [Bacteroidota bacterium]
MRLNLLKPSTSLNPAFRKTSLKRDQIELFKANLKRLFDRINEQESEEHLKNIVSDFLKDTWYRNLNEINTKGRADLVIHNGKSSSDTAGVIFEVKRPGNIPEMISAEKPNEKALHELLKYYLEERYINNNKEIKHLIVTNILEWYIFDGADFERFFFENQKLTKQYKDWHDGLFGVKLNDWFYQEIAKPFIEKELTSLNCTWFNLKSFETIIRNEDKSDDAKLLDLYKTLSPEHLLKKPFANDSNTLNKEFYNELLHIIGLEETKEGGKKLIKQKRVETRNEGSLLENVINVLKTRNKLSAIENPKQFGDTDEDQLFSIGLELCLTWLNRILFLKLLEGQLVRYHQGNKDYAFLNCERVKDFDELNELFFEVLAIPYDHRTGSVTEKFGNLPYLNSSLFEESDLEKKTLVITELKGRLEIPVHSSTVLKDSSGKRISGKRNTLPYLFEFLDAFDFASDNTAEIQEQNKTLINASVLGLIFEKINGYKDGSFFTPEFITMYMCRETIRRAVIQKFNEKYNWQCADFTDLYNKLERLSLKEANDTINSLKICDPAVGSGHFLVSALNEIISIKNDLAILMDREGKRLKGYNVTIDNDELILTQEDEIFFYNYKDRESQRIQETLFHEKQTIIENCLFGVDINPKSVMICRLRLWIELLKNAYYLGPHPFPQPLPHRGEGENVNLSFGVLETLPNIDINIKCGNSLISRYSLDADMKKALEKSKWTIESYRLAVMTYRNAKSKEVKREMERLIDMIKNDFVSEVAANDKRLLLLKKLNGELFTLTKQTSLFEMSKKEKDEWNKKIKEITIKIKKLETEIEEIKSNKIYKNAFEWRFEFPEVLNDDGDFVGFDVVIGNPPYIRQEELGSLKNFLQNEYRVFTGTADILVYFFEKGLNLLRRNGRFCMITSNKFMRANYGKNLRNFLHQFQLDRIIDFGELRVFEEASTFPAIYILEKSNSKQPTRFNQIKTLDFHSLVNEVGRTEMCLPESSFGIENWTLASIITNRILEKMRQNSVPLGEYTQDQIYRGILTGFNEAFVIDEVKHHELIAADPRSVEIIFPYANGDDIRKYFIHSRNRYLIFPRRGTDIEQFPAIKSHLEKHKDRLFPGIPGGRKPGSYKWFEIQDSISYYKEFFKPKIVFPDIAKESRWAYSENALFIGNTAYIIPLADKFLLGLMNSRVVFYFYSQIASVLGDVNKGGRLRWIYQDVVKIPVPIIDEKLKSGVINIVDQILSLKTSDPSADTTSLETEIDRMVYELYGLTEEEIRIVEGKSQV